MKLKINKACDLSSISVLPPHSRRPTAVATGAVSSQVRSQLSQQSFSQGLSSQHGMFSQLSQNSMDDVLTNDQRFGSQERENSVKKVSGLPLMNYTREESQMPMSRSSTNLMRRWNPVSVPDHKCQMSEELEHRIGMMETSLNRFGMILDSVQSDIMQINRGTKDVSMGTEGIRQKLIVQDNLLQLMNKGQEDIKASLDGGLKNLSDQLSKDLHQEKLQDIFLVLSSLPEQIRYSQLKVQNELSNTFIKEIQAMVFSLKTPNREVAVASFLPPKGTGCHTATQTKPHPPKNPASSPAAPPKACLKETLVPKDETRSWNSIKVEATSTERAPSKVYKRKGISSFEQETVCRVIIESDEEIDGGFSCLIDEKETDFGNCSFEDAKEETKRILRKARREKRKFRSPIIIN
ncbi:hypothetical protein CFOL_v3_25183 [Cephalotus follicularis]|uniref:Protein PAIR1 n=1 Tax=Cephalotus follicularis TaxID=3775 RepID=A0A1Q3CNB3_CEPFO|nr:hypothetical protein CFOL_v3_25183 [Cephalotus follicularis]